MELPNPPRGWASGEGGFSGFQMLIGREPGAGPRQTLQDLQHCLLLIRAPSDRAIYEAFRAVAGCSRSPIEHEQLWIEGDVPLTAGLSISAIPSTIERLLDADSEMIDKLELQVGELRITYLRSGGHAPYRESFFDEIHLELPARTTFDRNETKHLLEVLFQKLSVSSHTGTELFVELIADCTHGAAAPDALPERASQPSNWREQ